MKKLLLTIAILFSFNLSYSQLTNAQSFNFEIGDVFQATYSGNGFGPPTIETDTVIDKFYSIGLDTLFYVMNHSQYIGAFPPDTEVFNHSTDTITITNLNAPVTHSTWNTCLPATDTTLTDACGATFERLHSNYDTTCFEPPTWRSDFYVGLGGPYYYTYDPTIAGPFQSYEKTLTYYNSSSLGECGNFIAVNLNELDPLINVSLSPNPATNELLVTTELDNWSYTIYSNEGKRIATETSNKTVQSIDVSSLQQGVFFIHIMSDRGVKTISFIKQ